MKRIVTMLMAIAFVVSITVIAARAAPTKKAFTSKAAVGMVLPLLATVPTMTGYDVIQNLSTETRIQLIAQNTFEVDTSTRGSRSPTRDVNLYSRDSEPTCRSGTSKKR